MELFRLLGSNYADLSTDELNALLEEWRSVIARLADRDSELVGEMTDAELIAAAQAGTEGILEVQGLVDERTESSRATDEELRQLAERAGAAAAEEDETPPGEGEDDNADGADAGNGEDDAAAGDGEDGEEDEAADGEDDDAGAADAEGAEQEALVARGARARGRRVPAAVARRNQPQQEPERRGLPTQMRTLANVPGIPAGTEVDGMGGAVEAVMETFHNIAGTLADGQRVPILRARHDYPEERRVDARANAGQNTDVLMRARRQTREALVAAGGFCAPFTPIYDMLNIAVADEPVADSLINMGATRGGIQFATPMGLADLDPNTTGIITAAEDAAGGTTAVKTFGELDCPDFKTVEIDAVYSRLRLHNMGARAWPEQVQWAIETAAAQHARLSEVHLLDAMVAAADSVTDTTPVIGAVGDFINHLIRAAVVYRSAQRMLPTERFDAWVPAWVADALLNDIFRSQFYRFDFDRDSITAELRKAGVDITWYIDSPTGANQTYAKQAAGALQELKTVIHWFLAPKNSLYLLDGGTLDFGLVRDSVLNEVNQYELFSEVFENLVFMGHQLLHIQSTLCYSGAASAPVTVSC